VSMRIRLFAIISALCLSCLDVTAAAPEGLPNFVALAEQVNATVVNISTTQPTQQLAEALPGYPQGEPYDELLEQFVPEAPPEGFFDSNSLGSGLIISRDGEILTNYHVIKGAQEIIVKLADRRQLKAQVVGVDVASDLALLRIEAEDLPVA